MFSKATTAEFLKLTVVTEGRRSKSLAIDYQFKDVDGTLRKEDRVSTSWTPPEPSEPNARPVVDIVLSRARPTVSLAGATNWPARARNGRCARAGRIPGCAILDRLSRARSAWRWAAPLHHFATSPLHGFATLPLRPASSLARTEQPAPALSIVLGRHRVAVRNAATGETAVFEDADRGRVSLEGRGLDRSTRGGEDPWTSAPAASFVSPRRSKSGGCRSRTAGGWPLPACSRGTDERLARADDAARAIMNQPTSPDPDDRGGDRRASPEHRLQIPGRPGQQDRDRERSASPLPRRRWTGRATPAAENPGSRRGSPNERGPCGVGGVRSAVAATRRRRGEMLGNGDTRDFTGPVEAAGCAYTGENRGRSSAVERQLPS